MSLAIYFFIFPQKIQNKQNFSMILLWIQELWRLSISLMNIPTPFYRVRFCSKGPHFKTQLIAIDETLSCFWMRSASQWHFPLISIFHWFIQTAKHPRLLKVWRLSMPLKNVPKCYPLHVYFWKQFIDPNRDNLKISGGFLPSFHKVTCK